MGRFFRRLTPIVVILAILGGLAALVLYKIGGNGRSTVSIEQIQLASGVPVEVTSPVRMNFTDYLYCDGNVAPDVRAVLRAKIEEVVEAVHVRTGDVVQKGQLLVEFRTLDLDAAIAAAEAAHEEASNNYTRQQNLAQQNVVSQERLEQARTAMENAATALRLAKSRRAFAEIRSPIDGVVSGRTVEPGEFMSVGKELVTIVDLSTVEVDALVPAEDVSGISIAQRGEFLLESASDWYEGTVSRISPSTDDPNRFFDVFLSVENRREDGRWLMRPGMYADVRFAQAHYEGAVGLQADAVVFEGAERVVYLVQEMTVRVPAPANPGAQSESEDTSAVARIARGLARVQATLAKRSSAQASTEVGGEQKFVQKQQLQPVRQVVQVGLQSKGYVQVLAPHLSLESRVIVNPSEAVREGVLVRIVGGGRS